MKHLKLRDFQANGRWIIAETKSENQQRNTLVRDTPGPDLFVKEAAHISEKANGKRFKSRLQTVLYLGGHTYRTMDKVIEEADLINRAESTPGCIRLTHITINISA